MALLLTLYGKAPLLAVELNTGQIEKNHKLQNIRTQIKDVETSIASARKNVEQLFQQLQTNEVAAAEVATNIQQVQQQISEKDQELGQLGNSKAALSFMLVAPRKL